MIEVKIDQLFFSNMGFVLMLKSKSDERSLPIFIGAPEAQSIALHLKKVEIPRPLTHDLLKNILDLQECRLKRVEIYDLKDNTFYGRLILERDEAEMQVDSRPSDSVALALRARAPIYVADKVMEEAGRIMTELNKGMGTELTNEKASAPKEDLTPLETLKNELEKAIKAERYEDAAKLRDEINHLEHDNKN